MDVFHFAPKEVRVLSHNLNYVPWLSLFTVIGIGGAYLGMHYLGLGVGRPEAEANLPLLYGAAGGALVGVVMRTVVRLSTRKKQTTEKPS